MRRRWWITSSPSCAGKGEEERGELLDGGPMEVMPTSWWLERSSKCVTAIMEGTGVILDWN